MAQPWKFVELVIIHILPRKFTNKKAHREGGLGYFTLSAEREGFEPPDLLQSTVFKTVAIDHSAISLNDSPYAIHGAKVLLLTISARIFWLIFLYYS